MCLIGNLGSLAAIVYIVKRTLLLASLVVSAAFAGDRTLLWMDPGPIESLDLAAGPGGRNAAPAPPFTFVEEEKKGTAPKVTVRDSRGANWVVKFGPEVKSENFAARIAWAAGYHADVTYFVPSGTISGASGLGRAKEFIDAQTGAFKDARFELRNASTKPVAGESWSLTDPGLKDSRELGGLKVLLVLLANWDVKPENMAVLEKDGQRVYAITDWGASMGRTANLTGLSRWDCKRYSADSQYVLDGIEEGYVIMNYNGKQSDRVTNNVKQQDLAWFMQRTGKLTDAQIKTALEASGATPDEIACFAPAFRMRLNKLQAAAQGAGSGTGTVTTKRVITTTKTTTAAPE